MASKSNSGGDAPPPSENGQPKKGESVVHVRADSESTLDALFGVVTNAPGSTTQLSIPLRYGRGGG